MAEPVRKIGPGTHAEHLKKAVGHHARISHHARRLAAEHYRETLKEDGADGTGAAEQRNGG